MPNPTFDLKPLTKKFKAPALAWMNDGTARASVKVFKSTQKAKNYFVMLNDVARAIGFKGNVSPDSTFVTAFNNAEVPIVDCKHCRFVDVAHVVAGVENFAKAMSAYSKLSTFWCRGKNAENFLQWFSATVETYFNIQKPNNVDDNEQIIDAILERLAFPPQV